MSARWDTRPRSRAMTVQDLRRVVAVEKRIYDFPWTEGNFRDALVSGYDAIVLDFDSFLVGYRVMMVGAGEAHLLNLSVDAQWQRRGFGRLLLLECIRAAREAGATVLFLEVRPTNAAGIALYHDVGFLQVGLRKGYYPAIGGREDALVMSLPL